MRKLFLAVSVIVAGALVLAGAVAFAKGDNGKRSFSAKLNGYNEAPSKSTVARGTFRAKIQNGGSKIHFKLQYEGLETDSLFAHIHFAQKHVNGGIHAFLCGGGSKPTACPLRSGMVEGDIVASDVVAATPDQGIENGSMGELVRAIRAGATYVNVHTTRFPAGEIRGQIGRGGGD
jgi:hypothetical protein